MKNFKTLFIEKVGTINYYMAIHEGNAKQRLASHCRKILQLPTEEVPTRFLALYKKLIDLIKTELSFYPKGHEINNFIGKRNRTAAKYIKLLMDIESELRK